MCAGWGDNDDNDEEEEVEEEDVTCVSVYDVKFTPQFLLYKINVMV